MLDGGGTVAAELELEGQPLLEPLLAEEEEAGPLGEFEAVIPEKEDLADLTELLLDGFSKFFEPNLLPAAFGPLADLWNGLYMALQRQVALVGLRESLRVQLEGGKPGKGLAGSFLGRPRGRQLNGHSRGLMLVPRRRSDDGEGQPAAPPTAPVAFCELLLLSSDGRRTDETLEQLAGLFYQELDEDAEPYVLNLCVASSCRRRGLGRAMVRLAEAVVRKVWGDDRLFLHAENETAAVRLYHDCGYQRVKPGPGKEQRGAGKDGHEVIHMMRDLRSAAAAAAAP